MIKDFVDFLNEYVWGFPSQLPWLVILLVGSGLFITFRMGWIQIRQFGHAIGVIRGKYDNPADEGDINHFQALTTALSATVGIGNIAGVATAVHYGGPGAIFWMWITAIFGMALKFGECTLALHFRTFDSKGNASGGPMYYIEKGMGKNWKWMAMTFAFLAIIGSFGSGNMNQANTVAVSAQSDFGVPDWISGLIMASLVGIVILGGIRRIGNVTSKLMPAMAILYILGSLVILVKNGGEIPRLFSEIFDGAFNPQAAFGGSAAGAISLTLLWGVKRGLFSNESGQGSAPIAHAAAKTKEPVREGVVAMVGPFIDTLVICTMTGLVIILADVWDKPKQEVVPFDPGGDITVVAQSSASLDLTQEYKAINRELYSHMNEEEFSSFAGTFQVIGGKTTEVVYEINDGWIQNGALLQDGNPYSGSVSLANGSIEDASGQPLSLEVQGGMLQNSSALTAWSFQLGLADFFDQGNLLVTISVFLFGLSTAISWSYYGDRCVTYLFGERYVVIYRFCFVFFTFLGAILALETVWTFGDVALGLMTVPNLIGVLALSGVLVKLSKDYFSREHKTYK